MPARVVKLSSSNFEAVALAKNSTPVLVDFWAPWCGPCRKMKPVLASLARALGGLAVVAELNVDDEARLADAVRIESVPTLVLLLDGVVKDVFVGLTAGATLKKRILELSNRHPTRRRLAKPMATARPTLGARP